ncbi:LPXTG cell wall anchor domain-containing protein [Enterobacter sichuanensis]|uniref:LPXTG cell wall anchor domain-containing protein n=1 Tax=Enterobacter sichuanensis TaxID=2071710 RepID=UPI001C9AED30|nr:LPXTG cell wall anchor domain-containing protein [Enterobacter sichuanensis]MBY6355306.1 LPXTG cell wall anchor domain-containing protein [Enterobacter sichuanensis]
MIIQKSVRQMKKEAWTLIAILYLSSISLLMLTVNVLPKTGVDSFYIIGVGLMALTSLLSWKEAYKLVNCINEAKGTKKPD